MRKREARRLALLIAWDELSRSLDVSDEWAHHPETDVPFTVEEMKKVKQEAEKIVEVLERRASSGVV
jgi:UDP-N-acetylmuramate-alanine ligase